MENKKLIYCPYSNQDITNSKGIVNNEHIIPLSCGGNNNFKLPVSMRYNSTLGSEVDAKMANDPLILFKRTQNDIRGQSRKRVVSKLKWKDSKSKKPLQITFNETSMKIYCPITERNYNKNVHVTLTSASNDNEIILKIVNLKRIHPQS